MLPVSVAALSPLDADIRQVDSQDAGDGCREKLKSEFASSLVVHLLVGIGIESGVSAFMRWSLAHEKTPHAAGSR